jgi:site-specific DNA-cytosine methylase
MHTYAYYLSSRKRFADWATANSASLLPSFNKEEAQIAFCHICLAMFYPILFGASFGRGDKVDTISTVQKDNMIIEPAGVGYRGRMEDGKWVKRFESNGEPKANALTTATTDSMCAEPIRIPEYGVEDKSRPVTASYAYKGSGAGSLLSEAFPDNPNKQVRNYVAVPVRVGDLPNSQGEISGSQATRIYAFDGKSVNLVANGGGQGAKTGLYAMPIKYCNDKNMEHFYEVKNGLITIKDKQYPIKLVDGYYIIRKLTVTECCRLQTMPDDYCRAVSNSQAYKGLGNGWTAEVIIHILNGALKDVPRDEEIVVLSMYDGIGTGRYCLDKMGFTNVKYYAYEIDKYAKQIAMSNYPDIIQCGDAFAVRDDDWEKNFAELREKEAIT